MLEKKKERLTNSSSKTFLTSAIKTAINSSFVVLYLNDPVIVIGSQNATYIRTI